ncbi:phosphate acetyltransferase [Solitalea canadensis]|uniref:Phosphate acetyltransferase n=1 Tax=Solitalea canadensis (strain ATCC 29591 / DSM 3403 / JCM 21819 / LMG 8368 / NBRC 15130 / NCIMB 12057 / USAM 9D) TaxID=929556 RepID=H8KTC5_SOLCM|nr:phosphate acetyltransferase [Solitalea canadensis]AFD06262.1 phosphate acetyltransferase [Solitalea canadensis DSM 3403]
MTNAIYIATSEPYSGKSVVALGLMNMLSSKAKRIAYFKPIVDDDPVKLKKDSTIQTIIRYFELEQDYTASYAFTRSEVFHLINMNKEADIIDAIIRKYKILEESYDFVLIEGSDFIGEGTAFEFDLNVSIAKNLGVPVIIVLSGEEKTIHEVSGAMRTAHNSFNDKEVQVLGVIANKIDSTQAFELTTLLKENLPARTIKSVIPGIKELSNPTMQEIFETLKGKLLFGENKLTNQVDNAIVGAMMLRNFLTRLRENTMVVTPGDRADIIISALQANISKNYPPVAGLVLTGDLLPDEPVLDLIEGLDSKVPIIATEKGTFETTNLIGSVRSRIYPDNTTKIELAINTFERYVDTKELDQRIITFEPEGITPRMFQYQLVKRAKKARKHIVLPEGNDDRILTAAARLVNQDIVDLTVIGNKDDIQAAVKRLALSVDINKFNIVKPTESEHFQDFVETFFDLRKEKGVNMDMARDMMSDVSYFGTMMVYKGLADGMVSGAVHTTQHTIRPALQFVKTKPGVSVVSSVFFMCLPDRVSVFGDCAVNPNPTAEQLSEIAISSAESSLMFGIEPKIAMLSYSSGTSGQGEEVEKVRKATEIVKEKRPDLKIEGPIQYDAAVDPTVGKQKMPNSDVAGQASVLIFPDLNTGNNTYKAVQRETGALAIGPMLQGLNKPVNDLSRGCTVDDIFNTVVITAIQAQE